MFFQQLYLAENQQLTTIRISKRSKPSVSQRLTTVLKVLNIAQTAEKASDKQTQKRKHTKTPKQSDKLYKTI